MKFTEQKLPTIVLARHRAGGGRDVHYFVAPIGRVEFVRVMAAIDPTEKLPQRHLSVSVGRAGRMGATRRPTDEELKSVIAWAVGKWAGLSLEEVDHVRDPMVRQLWEVGNG